MFDHRLIFRLAAFFGAAFVAGCSSELASLTDEQLQDRVLECKRETSLSPGKAITCDNYERECQRRRKEGRYVC